MPEMGMKKPRSRSARASRPKGLIDALFSTTQQRVLGLLFGQPDRSFYATEMIMLTGSGSGAVQRELAKLEQSGLVITRRHGTQKHFQANPESPLFDELSSIARKTVGLAEPLRDALKAVSSEIVASFVYGSVAKRSDTARSDIDLMIISDTLTYPEAMEALQHASERLGREVNPTIYSAKEFEKRRAEGNAFLTRVLEQSKIWVIGNEDAFSAG